MGSAVALWLAGRLVADSVVAQWVVDLPAASVAAA